MRIEQVQVDVDGLLKGMYVCALDRPWLSTPFPFQGFVIRGDKDINALRKYCNYVYVDVLRGVPPSPDDELRKAWRPDKPKDYTEEDEFRASIEPAAASSRPSRGYDLSPVQRKAALVRMPRADIKAVAIKVRHDQYRPPKQLRKELKKAVVIHRDLNLSFNQMVDDVRVGRGIDVTAVRRTANKMIDSIIRHPDALVWLGRLKEQDNYSYAHSVRSSIISVAVGRHVGLHEPQMFKLALGSLLCEVGKAKLPRQLLEKRAPLNEDEVNRLQGHVQAGVEVLDRSTSLDDDVLEVVRTHHERFDGSGYPDGLAGDEIPLLGRIAGMVDAYDAMTNIKPYTDKVYTTSDTVDFFYSQRDQQFQSQLVEEFIQAIGLYPTGTLVELSSGAVALVLSQNPAHRLQPEVLLVLNASKKPLDPPKQVNLQGKKTREGQPVLIKRALVAGEHGLDATSLLQAHMSKAWDWRKVIGLKH